MNQFDLGYYAGYMGTESATTDADWASGWLQGGVDFLAGTAPPAQLVFDVTIHLLLKQGRPSLNQNSSCQYRGSDGLKCAAGFWIRDEDYKPSFENQSVAALDSFTMFPNGFWLEHHNLLRRLQRLHDTMPRVRQWTDEAVADLKRHAKLIALESNLEWRF